MSRRKYILCNIGLFSLTWATSVEDFIIHYCIFAMSLGREQITSEAIEKWEPEFDAEAVLIVSHQVV